MIDDKVQRAACKAAELALENGYSEEECAQAACGAAEHERYKQEGAGRGHVSMRDFSKKRGN